METAIILFQMLLIWLFSLLLAFVGGCLYSRIKKRTPKQKPHTAKDTDEFKKAMREYENFLTYTGQPQDVIND